MNNQISKIVWTRKARESLKSILEYRYSEIPSARKIVKSDIIKASRQIKFPEQFQKDDILPEFRRIIVRDYKLIYTFNKNSVFILNVVCTKAK